MMSKFGCKARKLRCAPAHGLCDVCAGFGMRGVCGPSTLGRSRRPRRLAAAAAPPPLQQQHHQWAVKLHKKLHRTATDSLQPSSSAAKA